MPKLSSIHGHESKHTSWKLFWSLLPPHSLCWGLGTLLFSLHATTTTTTAKQEEDFLDGRAVLFVSLHNLFGMRQLVLPVMRHQCLAIQAAHEGLLANGKCYVPAMQITKSQIPLTSSNRPRHPTLLPGLRFIPDYFVVVVGIHKHLHLEADFTDCFGAQRQETILEQGLDVLEQRQAVSHMVYINVHCISFLSISEVKDVLRDCWKN
mmetsp:Transcript_60069/g.143093  ORF Transcript_60069/g.143093 Transcript_60069/m.143093 type:complete len:208 (-) Transcript_60069:605-1228(-)